MLNLTLSAVFGCYALILCGFRNIVSFRCLFVLWTICKFIFIFLYFVAVAIAVLLLMFSCLFLGFLCFDVVFIISWLDTGSYSQKPNNVDQLMEQKESHQSMKPLPAHKKHTIHAVMWQPWAMRIKNAHGPTIKR